MNSNSLTQNYSSLWTCLSPTHSLTQNYSFLWTCFSLTHSPLITALRTRQEINCFLFKSFLYIMSSYRLNVLYGRLSIFFYLVSIYFFYNRLSIGRLFDYLSVPLFPYLSITSLLWTGFTCLLVSYESANLTLQVFFSTQISVVIFSWIIVLDSLLRKQKKN